MGEWVGLEGAGRGRGVEKGLSEMLWYFFDVSTRSL